MAYPAVPYDELIEMDLRERITPIGMQQIRELVYDHTHVQIPDWFDPRWNTNQRHPKKTKEVYIKKLEDYKTVPVTFRGKFVGRVEQYCQMESGKKLTQNVREVVGRAASDHMLKEAKAYMDFTKKFNWSAGDFGDTGSCFWSDSGGTRARMMSNEFAAVRLYDPNRGPYDDYPPKRGTGIARAWIGPGCRDEIDMVLINGYIQRDQWSYYSHTNDTTMLLGQLAAEFLGKGYKLVKMRDTGIYVNGGRGILIGESGKLKGISVATLNTSNNRPICIECGKKLRSRSAARYWQDLPYCLDCYRNFFDHCDMCGRNWNKNTMKFHLFRDETVCGNCFRKYTVLCAHDGCDDRFHTNEMWVVNGVAVCPDHRFVNFC